MSVQILFFYITSLLLWGASAQVNNGVKLYVLGTAQDAGAPQIGCQKSCCSLLREKGETKAVVAMGIIDSKNNRHYLIEASPNLTQQFDTLSDLADANSVFGGIFLTHAHIGHYSGLIYLGKEAMGGNKIPVYAMPRMQKFIKHNAPWEQLLTQQNIELFPLKSARVKQLSPQLSLLPIIVPHRDEYSETVGYLIQGPEKKALFIPDIDKWERWEKSIIELIDQVDYAFVDATFYDDTELPNRNINDIPHPFVVESIRLFEYLNESERDKVYFIHFNHSNPLLNLNSKESLNILRQGYHIAQTGMSFTL